MSDKIRKDKIKKRVHSKTLKGAVGRRPRRGHKNSLFGLTKSYLLARLEDSDNVSRLAELAANGTFSAHKRATEISDEIIVVRNGKLIRERRGRKPEVLRILSAREVNKGDTIVINNS